MKNESEGIKPHLEITQGAWTTVDNNKIIYKNNSETNPNKEESRRKTYLRGSVNFGSGAIEYKFTTTHYKTSVALLLTNYKNEKIFVGNSITHAAFMIGSSSQEGLQPFVKGGSLKNYSDIAQKTFSCRTEVIGSNIKLYVNEVLMCEHTVSIKESPFELYVASDGEVEVFGIQIYRERPKIFVVMQFSKEYDELFEEVIKPVVEKMGYDCIRGDMFYKSQPILSDIIQSIIDSEAIIAEITPDNPNVFYEIGYSHAIDKPTILLCDKERGKIPFDISGFRTLFYENTIPGKTRIENDLRKYIAQLGGR
ncbi:MAG: hypothetical protein SFV52_10800 [Saprospiraceae bacterium]|nr:hypothetical protein [Saprospiraceae bacterium]